MSSSSIRKYGIREHHLRLAEKGDKPNKARYLPTLIGENLRAMPQLQDWMAKASSRVHFADEVEEFTSEEARAFEQEVIFCRDAIKARKLELLRISGGAVMDVVEEERDLNERYGT